MQEDGLLLWIGAAGEGEVGRKKNFYQEAEKGLLPDK